MATTSTNKQPLLVDRILHYVVDLKTSINNDIRVLGTNSATLLVDSTTADGAIIEDIYAVSTHNSAHTINLYISNASDYLRPTQGFLIGQIKQESTTQAGTLTHIDDLPSVLTPVPHVGTSEVNHALYIPKGKALWAARQSSNDDDPNSPLLGCQGGWY